MFTTFSLTYPMACWYGFTRPIPRRLHTQILCDEGEDGTYIRYLIKFQSKNFALETWIMEKIEFLNV